MRDVHRGDVESGALPEGKPRVEHEDVHGVHGVDALPSCEDRAQEQTMEEVGAASPSSLPSPSEVLAAARRLGRRGAGLTQEVNVWPPLPVLGGVGSEEVRRL